MEIEEEDDDDEKRDAKRQSTVKEEDDTGATEDPPHSPISGPPITLNSDLATAPEAAQFSNSTDPPSFVGLSRPSSPAKSIETDPPPRLSSQSARGADYYDSLYKPRVKLGPRPSVETTRNPGGVGSRPVASMPAGLKLSVKGAKKGAKTQDDSQSLIDEEPPAAAAIPEHMSHLEPPRPHTSGGRPSSSSGVSVKSLSGSLAPPSKQNTITPEKLRLMKAMQLREKKKRAIAKPPPMPAMSPDVEEVDDVEAIPADIEAEVTPEHLSEILDELPADQVSLSKVEADSTIDDAFSNHHDQRSINTRTDSRPTSPIGAPSEVADSTKASSLSESTDETLHVQEEKSEHQEKAETKEVAEAQLQEAPTAGVGLPAESAPVEAVVEDSFAIDPEQKEDTPRVPATQIEEPEARIVETVPEEAAQDAGQDTTDIVEDLPAEEPSPVIPTPEIAATPEAGQAVAEPDTDPLDAELGSRKADEVEIAPVETSTERTQDGPATSPSKWKLPISKYSTQDSKSPASPGIPSIVTPLEDDVDGGEESISPAMRTDEDAASEDMQHPKRPEPIHTGSDLSEKKTVVDDETLMEEAQSATPQEAKPIFVSKSPLSASPPALASRPTTPLIIRTVSNPVPKPLLGSGEAPPPSATRSASSGAAFLQKGNQPNSAHLAPVQPGKIGSSISQRIKALEQLAASAPGAAPVVPVAASKDRPNSAFFAIRRSSVIRDAPLSPSVPGLPSSVLGRSPSVLGRSPSVLGRSDSMTRSTPPRSDTEGSPDTVEGAGRGRSGSVASRLSVFEGAGVPRGRPETIQVTARIVREVGQAFPRAPGHSRNDSTGSTLSLKQSPLIVNHQKAKSGEYSLPTPESATTPVPALDPAPVLLPHLSQEQRKSIQERRWSKDKKNASHWEGGEGESAEGNRPRRRSSLNIVKDFIKGPSHARSPSTDETNDVRPPSAQRINRLSISSRRASVNHDVLDDPNSPNKPLSPGSATDLSGSGDEKKSGSNSSLKEGKNRASRFMRRLSSSLTPGGRTKNHPATSPTVTEENSAELDALAMPPPEKVVSPATIVAYLGDVNVQFPDSLLWKRRTMALDSHGFLMLSASSISSARDKKTRRYHLSDFKTPFCPEMEAEELPNSVCLDFVDGSGLQVASSNRLGQREILQSKSLLAYSYWYAVLTRWNSPRCCSPEPHLFRPIDGPARDCLFFIITRRKLHLL